MLPIFIKLYFDAGLKQLATKCHHGSTLRILTNCSKLCVTHRFLLEASETILRQQVKIFLTYISDDFIAFQNNFDNIIYDIISTLDLTIG
jgi:hypothetical protein